MLLCRRVVSLENNYLKNKNSYSKYNSKYEKQFFKKSFSYKHKISSVNFCTNQ